MSTRRLWLIAIISITAILTATVTLVATTHHSASIPRSASTRTLTSTPGPPPTSEPREPTTDVYGNRLDVTDDAGRAMPQSSAGRADPHSLDYLTAAPAGIDWQRIWGAAAAPVSVSDGPAQIHDGLASGFADTPQGAALAACDAIARALAAPEGIWQSAVRERYFGGGQPLLDRFAASRTGTPDAAQYVTVPEGIRILPGYRPDFAVVQIAVRTRDSFAYGTWPMIWNNADWRVRVPDNIDTLWQPAVPLDTLVGFGQWKSQ
ncbi:hypothetical protein K7711_19160 [Nocardia sp. CA2R105]|uniref:hypothetical protein n=1 Tax=Nocardia coffeae TaxID=2873381 RepID=UPI001CA75F74|nr:hypothetical protein [Nocardia coffeae]MBY8858606.1 hypothetical protein [Nocardia coffeae]